MEECCISIADGDHQPPPKAESGIPFVTIANIVGNNQFDFSDTMFVPQDYYDALDTKRRAQKNDILYSVVGSFGIPVFMKEDIPFVFQRHIAILRPNADVIFPRFLYYVMKSRVFYAKADAAAVGAAQRTVGLSALRNITINLPEINKQREIAGILSAYDDLIDNNQKQIKLLEEATQRLYKEWFVDLRFPGHEKIQIINGVPEGWNEVGLGELAPILTGKKDANYGTDDGQYLFFTCAQEPIKAPGFSFDCSAVILAGNGDFNVKLYRGKFEAYQRTYVFSPHDKSDLYLIYHAVRENMRNLFQGASGSTIKFLTKGMLEDICIIQPEKRVLDHFNEYSENIQKKIEDLNLHILLASEARNRLLPKLMNGEIEV